MKPTRQTRRAFLKAAAFSAAPMILPASVLGRGGFIAPSERIVMGAIGIGGRGSHDLGWMIGEPDVQFVAVCDVRKARRDAAKKIVDEKYGRADCAAYRDMNELLARPDIDAVLIATGDRWHATASIHAMRAGKDVYCEKPSCLNVVEGRAVVETAHRYGRVYQTGAQRLSEPNHVFAIEMARTGQFGPVHTAYADCRYRGGSRRDWLPAEPEPAKDEIDWDRWLGPCPWRPYNSVYVNHGWYNFHDFATDIAMWGAHTVAQAIAPFDMTGVRTIDFEFAVPDATMLVRLPGGVKLVLYRCPGSVWDPCEFWHGACGERLDGPEGWASAADGYSKPDVSSPALFEQFKKVLSAYEGRTQRPMNHVRDFFDCIKSRRETVANPGVMFRSMAICLAADVCEQVRRNLRFDLQAAAFVGDDEANRLLARPARQPWTI